MLDDWDESEDVEYIDGPADSAGSGDDTDTSADDSDNASDDSVGADASDDDSGDDDESDSEDAEASDDDSDEDDDADASDDDSDDDSGAAASDDDDDDDDDSDGDASGQKITKTDLDQGTDLPTGDNHDLVIPYEDVGVELEWPSYIAERMPDDFALTLSGDDMDDQTVTVSGAEWTEEGAVRFAFSWRQKTRAVTLKATSGDQSVTVWDKQVAGDLDTMIDWESKIDSLLTVDDADDDSDEDEDSDEDDEDDDEDDDTTDADGGGSSDGDPSDGQSI